MSSGLERSRVRIPLRKTFRFGTLAIPFTPLCQCLSEETLKAVGPFLYGVYARGSKISHQSALECVTVMDSTPTLNSPRSASMWRKTLPCTEEEEVEEEDPDHWNSTDTGCRSMQLKQPLPALCHIYMVLTSSLMAVNFSSLSLADPCRCTPVDRAARLTAWLKPGRRKEGLQCRKLKQHWIMCSELHTAST